MCGYTCVTECMWRSEGTLLESVFSFHHVGPRGRTQTVRLDSKHLYPRPPHQSWFYKRLAPSAYSSINFRLFNHHRSHKVSSGSLLGSIPLILSPAPGLECHIHGSGQHVLAWLLSLSIMDVSFLLQLTHFLFCCWVAFHCVHSVLVFSVSCCSEKRDPKCGQPVLD